MRFRSGAARPPKIWRRPVQKIVDRDIRALKLHLNVPSGLLLRERCCSRARQSIAVSGMKQRDDQITLRVAGPLRTALEDEAAAESRGLSNLIRKILIEHTARRVVDRTTTSA